MSSYSLNFFLGRKTKRTRGEGASTPTMRPRVVVSSSGQHLPIFVRESGVREKGCLSHHLRGLRIWEQRKPGLPKTIHVDILKEYPLSEGEARRRFGDTLHVASLGAIAKDDGTVRPIFDGTHSVRLNSRIHIEDHLHFPGPPCVARAMELLQDEGHHLLVGVAADVAKAHRRVKHRPEDHGYLGCRAWEDGPIWLNRVGTLSMVCAAYHFARLAGLVGRCALMILQTCPLFQFLFADDLKFFSGGARKYLDIWTILVFWLMVGAPFKWSKFRAGVQLENVGFAFDYFRFTLGLSERRAAWIIEYVASAEKGKGPLDHCLCGVCGSLGLCQPGPVLA